MKYNDIAALMNEDMQQVNAVLTSRLSSEVVLINQISSYIIHSGGKRLRPLLLVLVARALGYSGNYMHLMACVIELIHTATLLHDDVVDNSATRRGKNTANESWGNEAAVLTGDFLYSRAFEMMVEPDDMRIMQVLAKATNNIAQGEVIQLLNIGKLDITEAEYYATIEKKTGVLFAAATHIGGILGESVHTKELISFGMELGNSFQIIDDILDYTADSSVMGKEVGDDLREGKLTLPLIYALNQASKEDASLISKTIETEKFERTQEIIAIIKKYDGFDYAFAKASQAATQARRHLDFLPDSDYKQALLALCDLSLERKS